MSQRRSQYAKYARQPDRCQLVSVPVSVKAKLVEEMEGREALSNCQRFVAWI